MRRSRFDEGKNQKVHLGFAECKYVCKKLAELGINDIELSGGSLSSRPGERTVRMIKPAQESYFRRYAAELAQKISVPVILVGRQSRFRITDGNTESNLN